MDSTHSSRPPANRRTLLGILGGGAAVAGLLLVCFVLPAEYGIDPLGAGEALGLMGLAQASGTRVTSPAVPSEPVAGSTIVPVLQAEAVESRWGEEMSMTGAFIPQPERFHLDSRTITLGPFEGIEIKYHMSEGAGLVYSWTSTGPLLYDFHGQPDVPPPDAPATDDDYFESFDRDDESGKTEFHGTLVAPRTGIEGWFWENPEADTVTITLTAAGFFDWVYQNRDDEKTRLEPMDIEALTGHPGVPDVPLPAQ